MAVFKKFVVTNAGRELQALVIAGATGMILERVAISSTDYSTTDLTTLTSLSNIEVRLSVMNREIVPTNTVQLTVPFDNSQITTGFTANTYGIYAEGPNGEVLFAVADSTDGADYIPSGAEQPLKDTYLFLLNLDENLTKTFNTTPVGLVDEDDMNSALDSIRQEYGIRTIVDDDITTAIMQWVTENFAPIAHDSSSNQYGVGNSTNYGHLRLSNAVNSTSHTGNGYAATPQAVKTAYDEAVLATSALSGWKFYSTIGAGSPGNNLASGPIAIVTGMEDYTVITTEVTSASDWIPTGFTRGTLKFTRRSQYRSVLEFWGTVDSTAANVETITYFYGTVIATGAAWSGWKTVPPENHASTETVYGTGNANNYGHVRVSDSLSWDARATSGVASSPYAIKTVNDKVVALEEAAAAAPTPVTAETLSAAIDDHASNCTISTHTHALNSTSVTGTLPINKGGTGLTTSPSLRVNLASTSAANVLAASPAPGVTGTLGVANGGTGLTSAPSILVNLNTNATANVFAASPRPGITGILGEANGGTGTTSTANFCYKTANANITGRWEFDGTRTKFTKGAEFHDSIQLHATDGSMTWISFSGGTPTRVQIGGTSVSPQAAGNEDLGTSSIRWRTLYSTTAINSSSDSRLKSNQSEISSEIAEKLVQNIVPKSYNMSDDRKKDMGFIAQDVVQAFADEGINVEDEYTLVQKGEDGYYGMSYDHLIPILWKEVQNLRKEIEQLKS